MLSERQQATNYETFVHIELVMCYLAAMQHEIARRAFSHDRSKLQSPELEMFEQFTDRLSDITYGSEDYKNCLTEMKTEALGHHYFHNRHHPEHFEDRPSEHTEAIATCDSAIYALNHIKGQYPDDEYAFGYGLDVLEAHKKILESHVNKMNVIDLLEMVCDWLAACQRHKDGDPWKSLEINTERFGLSPQLMAIIGNTIRFMQETPNPYANLRSQRDL